CHRGLPSPRRCCSTSKTSRVSLRSGPGRAREAQCLRRERRVRATPAAACSPCVSVEGLMDPSQHRFKDPNPMTTEGLKGPQGSQIAEHQLHPY
ncbi:unnamed protein product, partial [Urochloa humidicola]